MAFKRPSSGLAKRAELELLIYRIIYGITETPLAWRALMLLMVWIVGKLITTASGVLVTVRLTMVASRNTMVFKLTVVGCIRILKVGRAEILLMTGP